MQRDAVAVRRVLATVTEAAGGVIDAGVGNVTPAQRVALSTMIRDAVRVLSGLASLQVDPTANTVSSKKPLTIDYVLRKKVRFEADD